MALFLFETTHLFKNSVGGMKSKLCGRIKYEFKSLSLLGHFMEESVNQNVFNLWVGSTQGDSSLHYNSD